MSTHNKDYGLQELHDKLKEMIVRIDAICRKHDIQYFLVGGSALGAVRHKGFIPWDDDFDIGMLREDYQKFQEIAPKEFEGTNFFWQTIDTEEEYNLPFGKIRDSSTTNMSKQHMMYKINHGVWIDVFCYETLPTSKIKQNLCKKISSMVYMAWNHDYSSGWLKNSIVKIGVKLRGTKQYVKDMVKISYNLGKNSEKEYMTTVPFPVKVPYSSLKETIYIPFEDVMLPVPKDYDAYLKGIFGNNYMQEPTEEQKMAVLHQPEILDLHKSYLEYVDKNDKGEE